MRISAGIGLLLMGLHGLVDFNLHIPANAVFFAFLAGIFFHPGSGSRPPELQAMAPPAKSRPNPVPLPVAPQAPLDVRNPFAD